MGAFKGNNIKKTPGQCIFPLKLQDRDISFENLTQGQGAFLIFRQHTQRSNVPQLHEAHRPYGHVTYNEGTYLNYFRLGVIHNLYEEQQSLAQPYQANPLNIQLPPAFFTSQSCHNLGPLVTDDPEAFSYDNRQNALQHQALLTQIYQRVTLPFLALPPRLQ